MITLLSYTIVLITILLVASHLRVFAQDAYAMLRNEFQASLERGRLLSGLAFGGLWFLIFGLAYI